MKFVSLFALALLTAPLAHANETTVSYDKIIRNVSHDPVVRAAIAVQERAHGKCESVKIVSMPDANGEMSASIMCWFKPMSSEDTDSETRINVKGVYHTPDEDMVLLSVSFDYFG